MRKFRDRLADILTYPARYFENLTDKKASLAAGIILVGVIDLFLPDVVNTFNIFFSGKSAQDILYNAVIAVFVMLALGIIDVVFIGVPLFDIFRYLKRKETAMGIVSEINEDPSRQTFNWDALKHKASSVKVMKIYIMSHFIIVPASVMVYYALTSHITNESPEWMQNLGLVFFMLTLIWSAAIMARGINTLFRFNPLFKRLTFMIVFTWNFIFSMVFSAQIINWLLRLFR